MRKLALAMVAVAMLLVLGGTARADILSGTNRGTLYHATTPCAAFADGRPIYDHLRYWAIRGWYPTNPYTWQRNNGQTCSIGITRS